jgi:hypothetical protein
VGTVSRRPCARGLDHGAGYDVFRRILSVPGDHEIFTPSGRVDWSEGFDRDDAQPFSASLPWDSFPSRQDSPCSVFDLGDFLVFISPVHPEGRCSGEDFARRLVPREFFFGVGVAIAGWPRRSFPYLPAHPRHGGQSAKTLYVFLLNRVAFDEVYATLIVRPTLRFAQRYGKVWMCLIDRPANGLAAASSRMATDSRKLTSRRSEPRWVCSSAFRCFMLLSFLAEEIEISFLW